MTITIVFFSAVAIFGLITLAKDLYEARYYKHADAQVTGFKEVYDTESPHDVTAYIPLVKFLVNGVEYQGRPQRAPLWAKPDRDKKIIVRYHPKNPGKFSLKPRSYGKGIFIFLIGAAGLLWVWENKDTV
jgi:hypothetical protein